CFSPFLLMENIHSRYSEKLNVQKEKSVIIKFFKYLLHNFLALNLRFLGVFIGVGAAFDFAFSLVDGGSLKLSIIAMIAGGALCFLDVNVTSLLKGSVLIRLLEKCLDTEFSFNFYYITKCEGNSRLICAGVFGAICGIICGLASPIYALLFVAGIFFVSLVLYKVEFGVFITVFLAPLVPTMAVVGLCLLCLLSLVIKALTTKKFTWNLEGTGLMVLVMAIIYFVASLTSFAPVKSVQIWAVYFAFMVFYFVIINTIKTEKQLFDLLRMFTISAVLVCLYGIAQYIFGWNVTQAWIDEEMFEDIKMRIYSTLDNPNVLGEYILLALPLCISLMWTAKKALPRIIYLGLSAILGVALILTFSRGCWLGIMAAAAIFVTFAAGKLWGLGLIALPLVPFIVPESILNRFTSIGDMSDSSTSYRVSIWMGTLLMLKDFWLSGIGLGSEAFTQVYPFYSYNMVVAQHPHNLFLHIITESGIIGLLAFLFLILLFFKKMATGVQVFGKGNKFSVTLIAISSAVTGFLLQGVFDNCFYNYRVFMIFWAVLAIGIAAQNITKSVQTDREGNANA
ncbi:MAG: O-antigen ligase family protein, partial [Clostridia bacterium]|nr:O-antigen ligase family protein [Clostridia bacterium]